MRLFLIALLIPLSIYSMQDPNIAIKIESSLEAIRLEVDSFTADILQARLELLEEELESIGKRFGKDAEIYEQSYKNLCEQIPHALGTAQSHHEIVATIVQQRIDAKHIGRASMLKMNDMEKLLKELKNEHFYLGEAKAKCIIMESFAKRIHEKAQQ